MSLMRLATGQGLELNCKDKPTVTQLILDCSNFIDFNIVKNGFQDNANALERQSISLCHTLHIERYRKLTG